MKEEVKIQIHSEYITLQQFLKFTGIISNGGEVKFFLQENEVAVNGEIEKRRGKKLRLNDLVLVNGATYKITNENS